MQTDIFMTNVPGKNVGVTFVGHAYVLREAPDDGLGQEILSQVTLLKEGVMRNRLEPEVQNEVVEMLLKGGALPQEGKEEEIRRILER